jgi:protein SCO1/2
MTVTGQGRSEFQWRWAWLAIGIVATTLLAVAAFAIFQPIKVLPRMRLAPGFSLIDQRGLQLTNEALRGHFVLYSFSYTRCGAACAQIERTLRSVQERLAAFPADAAPVTLVTITFDPEWDTPAVLAAHGRAVGADGAYWRLAAGDPALTKTIIGEGFEVFYQPDGKGGFQFDPELVLVDGWGIIRAEYRRDAPNPDRILQHLAVLQDEIRNSRGAGKLAYEAAHLFLCYAP